LKRELGVSCLLDLNHERNSPFWAAERLLCAPSAKKKNVRQRNGEYNFGGPTPGLGRHKRILAALVLEPCCATGLEVEMHYWATTQRAQRSNVEVIRGRGIASLQKGVRKRRVHVMKRQVFSRLFLGCKLRCFCNGSESHELNFCQVAMAANNGASDGL
jgi:hypothetical protein